MSSTSRLPRGGGRIDDRAFFFGSTHRGCLSGPRCRHEFPSVDGASRGRDSNGRIRFGGGLLGAVRCLLPRGGARLCGVVVRTAAGCAAKSPSAASATRKPEACHSLRRAQSPPGRDHLVARSYEVPGPCQRVEDVRTGLVFTRSPDRDPGGIFKRALLVPTLETGVCPLLRFSVNAQSGSHSGLGRPGTAPAETRGIGPA